MKNTFISILFCLIASYSLAQDNVGLNFAQNFTSFRFIDSQGNFDENMSSDIRFSYGVNYNKILNKGIFIRPEIGYKNFGATSVMNENYKMSWNLHYADINAGAGYIFNKFALKPYIGASFYFSYLFKAEQMMGQYYYNIWSSGEIKKTDFGINAFAGVVFAFSKTASVFLEFRNTTGLQQLELNSYEGQNQKLFNRAFSLQFGLQFGIPQNEKRFGV